MSTARLAPRWAGVLVDNTGRAVLLRSTTGSVVVPAPEDAVPPTVTDRVWDDNAARVWDDSATRTWDS